jgi:hypothetical protein
LRISSGNITGAVVRVDVGTVSVGGCHVTAAASDVPGVRQILGTSATHPDSINTAASSMTINLFMSFLLLFSTTHRSSQCG